MKRTFLIGSMLYLSVWTTLFALLLPKNESSSTAHCDGCWKDETNDLFIDMKVSQLCLSLCNPQISQATIEYSFGFLANLLHEH